MDFKTNTIRQIRIWAWAATVLPISALSAMFFVWRFSPATFIDYVFITGEVIMFSIAVIWWWWAMFTMRNLVNHWDKTKENVNDVLIDIKQLKSVIIDTLARDK